MDYRINHAGMDVVFKMDDIRSIELRKCVKDALQRFYGHFLQNSGNVPIALTYRMTDHIRDMFDENAQNIVMSESARINDYQCFFSGHGNHFGYEFEEGRLVTVYYQINYPGKLSNEKNKAISRDFISKVEAQIAGMYSRGFLHPLQIINLQNGASFLHACSFALGENGYIVAATPGAGKSSLLLSMAFSDEIRSQFISDDFSCVDANGYAHEIGRAIAIKSHQIQYFPKLKDRLKDMSFLQKAQWFLLKQRGLKRLAAPEDLFSGLITTNKKVKGIVYLTNHSKNTFEHHDMPVSEFADLNANMLFSELYLGMEVVNHALIIPGYKNVPTADHFISLTRTTLEKIFADVPCILVKVPFRSDPRQALQYLLDNDIITESR